MSHPTIEVKSRQDLRNWLERNYSDGQTHWLINYKKHTDHYVSYGEIVSELLCWGWVDSVSGKVDEDRSKLRISPRNPKSAWSAVNKAKVDEARAQGLMTPAGEALIDIAKSNGMWEFLDDVERLEVPADLSATLGDLIEVWNAYPRSVKRGTLEWIKTAKRTETRQKRIVDVVDSARLGIRPSIFR